MLENFWRAAKILHSSLPKVQSDQNSEKITHSPSHLNPSVADLLAVQLEKFPEKPHGFDNSLYWRLYIQIDRRMFHSCYVLAQKPEQQKYEHSCQKQEGI